VNMVDVSMARRVARLVVLMAGVTTMSACTIAPPQAWEKGLLAKPEMTMNGDSLEKRFTEHTYTSKEASSGGSGVGGGGCGCN
jgi:Domain of unknown function (DUF4266)